MKHALPKPVQRRLSREMNAPVPKPSWQPEPRHEQNAQTQERIIREHALSSVDLARMAPGPGRDFSRVNLHTDRAAGEMATDLGARACTLGDDIFFAPGEYQPGTAEGRGLLAHELAHVGQQADAGGQALQFDPKEEKAGIGAKPPAEPFITYKETGSEDGFVLFGDDDADLDTGDEKEILRLVGSSKKPVNLHIHGYASAEGPGEYNLNLSAHRAAAVKEFLERRLPEGSVVTLFAHGDTKAFGKPENNRRVGVSIMTDFAMRAGFGVKPQIGLGLGLSLGKPAPVLDPGVAPPKEPVHYGPGFLPSPIPWSQMPTVPPANGAPPPGPTILPGTVDWGELHGLFAARGTTAALEGADMDGDLAHFYQYYKGLGPYLGSKAAYYTLKGAYDAYLSANRPNIFDLSKKEFAAAYPHEWHTPIVPIITPDTIEFVRKLFGGKKKEGDK